MKEYVFEAVIIRHEKVNSGYIEFPFDVMKEFRKKGQVKVKAYFDGFEYRGSLINMGTPCHIIGLNKIVRDAIGKQPGDIVHAVITEDTDERIVDTPDDLGSALMENPAARLVFEKLLFTHRKEYIGWITSAKKQETRAARIEKCIEMLASGKRNPSEK